MKQKGQSLVEVALFFPIFLIILAGVVEVSQLIVTKNRITEATRSGARFGSNGGENEGMTTVTLNTITQTLDMNPEYWDIWTVRGQINDTGNGFDEWEFEHTYGLAQTSSFSDVVESEIQIDTLEKLQLNQSGQSVVASSAGLRFVGVYAVHDVNSMLGLLEWSGFHSTQNLAIMRFIGVDQIVTDGCDAFPIAVYEGVRSVSEPNTPPNPFPNPDEFHTQSPVAYRDQFIYHKVDTPLYEATEGTVFKIHNGSGSGNFGWLKWNDGLAGNAPNLIASMTWPGNSLNYTPPCNEQNPSCQSNASEKVWGYIEPGDNTDRELHVGDWIASATGNMNSDGVRDVLNGHIETGRALRLIIWDNYEGQGSNNAYKVVKFGVFRIIGYNITGNDSWILAEFLRFDESCGL